MSAVVLLCLLFQLNNGIGGLDLNVVVDTSKPINVVDYNYLGFTFDANCFDPFFRRREAFNFSSHRARTLVRALSPAILRVGGTDADCLFYNKPTTPLNVLTDVNVMTWMDWINLAEFALSTGNRLLFNLNLQVRYGQRWDPANAIDLLEFCSTLWFCDAVDWELGNEPDMYDPVMTNRTALTPEQIGSDFLILRQLLDYYDSVGSYIVGPSVASASSKIGGDIFSGVANIAGSVLTALTIHHYYFEGTGATYRDYLDASRFSWLYREIAVARSLVSRSRYPTLSIWLGETSDAYNGGTANVSDRFVSGFLWMEKLGLAASMGIKVVLRQTLFGGGAYALLDNDLNPNPDYWVSWLHKKLVGQIVFAVIINPSIQTTRVYAHCTRTARTSYASGALTVFALNIDQSATSMLRFTGPLASQSIHVYLLEADGPDYVLSEWVKLNGNRLVMPSDYLMPNIVPVLLPPASSISLPPVTMAYFVFPDANIQLCH